MALSKTDLAMLTIGGGSAVDVLKPDVTWLLDGCPNPRPASVDELVTIAAIAICLIAWHWFKNRDPKDASAVASVVGEDPVPEPAPAPPAAA